MIPQHYPAVLDLVKWRIRPEIEGEYLIGTVMSVYPKGNNGYSTPFMMVRRDIPEKERMSRLVSSMTYAVELTNPTIEVIRKYPYYD